MQTAEHFQDTFSVGFGEALEHAVLKRRYLIRDKLAVSSKEAKSSMDDCTSNSSMESSDNNSSDKENQTQSMIYGES